MIEPWPGRVRRFFWLAGPLVGLALRVEAGTYYVATNGLDSANGLSRTSAWQRIQHAVQTVGPGDTITVLAGDYAGALIQQSGTSNAPITLRADDGARVVLNAPGPSNRHTSILEVETFNGDGTVAYWNIEGFRVTGAPRYGIDVRSTHHIAIRSNVVCESHVTGIFTPFCYDMTIEGNESASNGEHGIYYNNSSDRFVIRRNVLHHNANCGLHMNGDLSVPPPDGTPWVGDGILSDGLVEGNVVFLNGTNHNGGAGINMDGVTHTVIRNNVLATTPNNSGIALYQTDGGVPSSTNWIVNNTILMAADGGWAINIVDAGCVSNTVLNNVLYNLHPWRGVISIPDPGLAGFRSDYNTVMDRFSIDGGANRIGLAAWQAYGYDVHSLSTTPSALFVDPAQDYHLRTNSPAIDRAIPDASVTNDFDGIPRGLDGNGDGTNAWDMGAFEFVRPGVDSDHDGLQDTAEVVAGTNPMDAASVLRLVASLPAGPDSMALHWTSASGRRYALLRADAPAEDFQPVATNLNATPPLNVSIVSMGSAQSGFYRIQVEP